MSGGVYALTFTRGSRLKETGQKPKGLRTPKKRQSRCGRNVDRSSKGAWELTIVDLSTGAGVRFTALCGFGKINSLEAELFVHEREEGSYGAEAVVRVGLRAGGWQFSVGARGIRSTALLSVKRPDQPLDEHVSANASAVGQLPQLRSAGTSATKHAWTTECRPPATGRRTSLFGATDGGRSTSGPNPCDRHRQRVHEFLALLPNDGGVVLHGPRSHSISSSRSSPSSFGRR